MENSLKLEVAAKRYWQGRRALPKRVGGIAKIVAREQIESNHAAARCQAIVPEALLRKKLGASTYRLWCALLTMRNDSCDTHPSVPGLVRATHLAEHQIERAFARLRQFGLLEDFGFHYLQVPCRCSPEVGVHEHKVYLRRVYGLLKLDREGQSVTALVPRETARLVKEAAAHGGARAGAGRPRTRTVAETPSDKANNSSCGAYRNQEHNSSEDPKGSSSECGVSLRANKTKKKAKDFTQRERQREALERFMAYKPHSLQPKEASLAHFTQHQGADVPGLRVDQPAPRPAASVLASLDGVFVGEDGSLGLRGGASRRVQRYTSDDVRAASTLAAQVVQERTPAPPKVQSEDDEEARLALLRVAYRAAHAKAFRQDYWRPARTQSAAERKALVEAAEALRVESLRPHSWALFSFLAWQRMGKKTAPTAKWVWSAARIHEHAQWCHDATGSQDSGAPLKCPSVTQLLHKLGRLRERLGWGRPTSEVLSEVLSDTERRVLLAKAAMEREAARMDIERRIKSGEWVWG